MTVGPHYYGTPGLPVVVPAEARTVRPKVNALAWLALVAGLVFPVLAIACPITYGFTLAALDPGESLSAVNPMGYALYPASYVTWIAVILGHMALAKIDSTGERGKGMAVAGLVLGYMSMGLMLMFVVGLVFFMCVILLFVM